VESYANHSDLDSPFIDRQELQHSYTYSTAHALKRFYTYLRVRGPFLTMLLGANFDPGGEVVPQMRILSPGAKLSPGVKIFCSPLHVSWVDSIHRLGVNEGVNINPRVLISPLGARGEVKNCPLSDTSIFA
jgi:hypothetical protein